MGRERGMARCDATGRDSWGGDYGVLRVQGESGGEGHTERRGRS